MHARASRKSDEGLVRLRSQRLEPIMFSDWNRLLFMHFEVDPVDLQREIPFTLDLFDGRAFVTVVAFEVKRLQPRFCGALGAFAFKPLNIGKLLNVRTYVRCEGEQAIFFLAEWLESRINLRLGPRLYGLPYRLGRLTYDHNQEQALKGEVIDADSHRGFAYRARVSGEYSLIPSGSLLEFLVERYSCFTQIGPRRLFRVWHPPWRQAPAEVEVLNSDLLVDNWPWLRDARMIGATYSPGLEQVWLGRPNRLRGQTRSAFLKMP